MNLQCWQRCSCTGYPTGQLIVRNLRTLIDLKHNSAPAVPRGRHAVHFHESDQNSLGLAAGEYFIEGLNRGEEIVAVATRAHQSEISVYLSGRGINPERIYWADSEVTLRRMTVNSWPCSELFDQTIRSLLARISNAQKAGRIRVYGDMVGLLWQAGHFAAAERLEALWNQFLEAHDAQLFCAYPIADGVNLSSPELKSVLQAHSHLIERGLALPLRAENQTGQLTTGRTDDEVAWRMVARAASQDLADPLRKIRMLSRLVIDGNVSLNQAIRFAGLVDGEAERVSYMLTRLHRYFCITRSPSRSNVNLSSVVRQAIHNLESNRGKSDAQVVVAKLPTAWAHEANLTLVFEELLQNALHFSGDQPTLIEVSAERVGRELIVQVRDNGIGIPEEFRELIFDPFYRVSDHEPSPGGIGLAICKKAMASMNGRIWIEANASRGSTFCLRIPSAI